METQTIDLMPDAGIDYDLNDRPSGISVEDWMNRLGRKLITHYGDDFRRMLNEARAERGMLPL